MQKSTFYILLFFSGLSNLIAQNKIRFQILYNGDSSSISSAIITSDSQIISTDSFGNGFLNLKKGKNLVSVSRLGFKKQNFQYLISQDTSIIIFLKKDIKELDEVEIINMGSKESQAEMVKINPIQAKFNPAPFQDFTRILAVIPGVISQNEFTTGYSVRGGNYDENLTYVNGMEVYRPFLARSGQQEGLSFVNPDLANQVDFFTGGWKAKYGDKISSVLDVEYKKPKKIGGNISIGLLGGNATLEGATKNQRISFIAGYREKNSQYLLNTLQTKGEYFPHFRDFQSYVFIRLGKEDKPEKTTLGILQNYAWNSYLVIPSLRESTFGTGDKVLRLRVAFDGTEAMQYDTYQGSARLTHLFSNKHKATFIGSYINSFEREYNNLESGYRLCDLDDGTPATNRCPFQPPLGTFFNYARNTLSIQVLSGEYKSQLTINSKTDLEWGFKQNYETIQDRLSEYSFTDSSDYVKINSFINKNNSIQAFRSAAYVMQNWNPDSIHRISFGVRFAYWNLNEQPLISPSIQCKILPSGNRKYLFHFGAGIYRQAPFYRELRGFDGELNTKLKAQSSFQIVAGLEREIDFRNRKLKWNLQAYYKNIWDVVPYDIDNVRIRYYATNSAVAYATGIESRIGGEFVKGTESWFSLGLMNTQESIDGNSRGYMRRPSDQVATVGIFLEDHIPKNPTLRAFISFQYGSGLPFGVPDSPQYRNAFNMPNYQRVDLGLSKMITFNGDQNRKSRYFKSIWIALEVLNLFGNNNTISYLWLSAVNNNKYAIPNTLSQRFINVRMIVRF